MSLSDRNNACRHVAERRDGSEEIVPTRKALLCCSETSIGESRDVRDVDNSVVGRKTCG
jgi:hypothetical protein